MLQWGVYFVVVSVVFYRLGTIDIIGFTLNQVVILGLFFLASVHKLIFRSGIYRIALLDLLLLLFGGYLWISNYLVSDNSAWGIRSSTDYFRSLACYFLVVFIIDSRGKINRSMLAYVGASAAMVCTANFLTIVSSGLRFSPEERLGLTGLAGSYIDYAIYSIMSIPIAFAFVKNSRGNMRRAFVLAMGVLCLATLFSGSRGAIVSFAVMVAAMVFVESRLKDKTSFLSVGFLVVLGIGLFTLFFIKGGGTLVSTLAPGQYQTLDASLAGRFAFQKKAFFLFLEHPLFGVGVDAFRNMSGFKHVPHNQWLQILTELGLFGLIFAVAMTYVIFRDLITARRTASLNNDEEIVNFVNAIGVSVFTLLFWGLNENIGFINANKVLFMLLGLSRSLSIYANNQAIPVSNVVYPFATSEK